MMACCELLDGCYHGGRLIRFDLLQRFTRHAGVFLRIHRLKNGGADEYGKDQDHAIHTNTEQEGLQRADNELSVGWFHSWTFWLLIG